MNQPIKGFWLSVHAPREPLRELAAGAVRYVYGKFDGMRAPAWVQVREDGSFRPAKRELVELLEGLARGQHERELAHERELRRILEQLRALERVLRGAWRQLEQGKAAIARVRS